ncbi:hypothetical protein H6P81_012916 [Aristolochia fimbriata]|uniref:Protein SCAR n=1 Tax=Aristolochia fimbriata TaxID=158543 RepID=A0AAV7EDH1_ARIFI|nr:hypothetical protein H6P81_012916 [Aristolochia fimbriata]
MPLVRFHVRNEFGLGDPELYRSVNKEDPRAILDGVAVSGLVGILRQLGDLAEFASEVFHELHEQVTITATRSHKMVIRVQNIEAALPPLEQAISAQRSHIHFAYTAGSDWHSDIKTENNHFSHSDLPQFIMDSYEECRGPPRLFLLDKFDPAGAGACLKRYSDPSFFRKACSNSELLKAEKAHKEKKSHHKRKGSRHKSGYISRASSMSQRYGSDRLRFVSLDTSGQLLTGENTPTFNMRSRSEIARELIDNNSQTSLGYHEHDMSSSSSTGPHEELSHIRPDSPFASQSTSLDSKSRLNNVCSSDSSVGLQGQEYHERYTAEPRVKFADDPSTSPNEQNEEHDVQNSPHVSFSEQGALRSSFVSWDEKTEILNPSCEQSVPEDQSIASECPPTSIPQSKSEVSTTSPQNAHQEDIVFDIENAPELLSCANHLEEVTSETDNYMDALNSMDTETETDSECQTKHEVELQHNVSPCGIESSTTQASTTGDQMSDSFDGESPTPIHISLVKERFEKPSYAHHQETVTHIEQPHPIQLDSNLDDAVNADFSCKSEPFDTSTVNGFESVGTVVSAESTTPNTNDNKVLPQSGESQKPSVISDVTPVQIWTNGGLLGLEPSKPSDFGISNFQKQDSQDSVIGCSETSSRKSNQSCPNGIANNQNAAGELDQYNVETSSSISGLTYRFLRNASWRKALPPVHMTTEPSNVEENNPKILPEGANSVERKSLSGVAYHDIHETTSKDFVPDFLQFGSPSPPLEHMKISFHPMNGIETSKLKLDFPDAPHFRENTQDVIFPSFQLLPESCNRLQDSGFESDDDTFCRSSPYLSDDPLSPHSDSNSEHWEGGEINGSGSQEFYDALRRVSSSSSISSVLGPEEEMDPSSSQAFEFSSLNVENGKKSSAKCASWDLPGFDAVSSLTSQQAGDGSNVKDSLDTPAICPIELPPPPPLPPLQWRKTKLNVDGTPKTTPETNVLLNDQQVEQPILINKLLAAEGAMSISENATYSETCEQPTDQLVMMPTPQKQAKPLIPMQIDGTTPFLNKNMFMQLDGQKVNGRKELKKLSQDSNGKDVNEREDFLHQIRTKSFSLRPTATARPNTNPSTTTNTKVTAILEKASAIRQAVGSDEGADDDNWSDS